MISDTVHFLIDATLAKRGGGLVDHLGFLPEMASLASDGIRLSVTASPPLVDRLDSEVGMRIIECDVPGGVRRIPWLLSGLPKLIRETGADALVGGQFVAPRHIPIPYVLRLTEAGLVDPTYSRCLQNLGWVERLTQHAKENLFQRALRGSTGVVVATRAVERMIRQETDCPNNVKIYCASFGASPVANEVDYEPSREWDGRLLTMHASPHKNVELILKALTTRRSWTLSIMANLEQPETGYERKLSRLVARYDLGDQVNSLGRQGLEGVKRALNRHDALVVSSFCESWSHGVIEGLAAGIPVVVSDIPVHREVAGKAGWYVDPDNVKTLLAVLDLIETDRSSVRQKIRIGREQYLDREWRTYGKTVLQAAIRAGRSRR